MINMVKWYFEKEELKTTPSVQQGLSLENEQRYRREGARFIIDLGSSMNLSPTTKATGVVFFHRFYMFHTFQAFPRYPTAWACLFLAGKVEETPKKCKDIVKFARDLLPDDKLLQLGPERNWTEEVMTLERILLQTIKFDFHVVHPYTFLFKYAKCLKGDKDRLDKMVEMAWTFVSDSLCTTLCLQWEPEIIAIALMYLAGKLSKFEVKDWNGRKSEHLRWWDMFVEDMSIDTLEDICHQVLDLYSQTQKSAPDSPPPQPIKLPLPNSVSAQVSPLANSSTPKAGSKTSTPIQSLTPIVPVVAPVGCATSLNPSAYPPPPPPYTSIAVLGVPQYNQSHPPPPPQLAFSTSNQPAGYPVGGFVAGPWSYPPPYPPSNPYPPPPPPE